VRLSSDRKLAAAPGRSALAARLGRAVLALAAASLAVTVLALGARLWWGFELLTHFRPQYAAGQLLLLAALALARRPRWCVAVLAGLAVNAVPLAPYLPRLGVAAAAASGNASVTVLAVNVEWRNPRADALLDIVRRESPDLLLVVELTEDWRQRLAELELAYPHRVVAPRADAFGLALYSRLPLERAETFDLETTAAIDAEVATPAGPFRFLGVHLRPPTTARWLAERNRQLELLGELASEAALPLVVAGDFNATPYSPYFGDFLDAGGLRTTLAGRAPGLTWPTFLPVLGIPIDHCAVSEEFIVIEHRRLPAVGSDHYPILARLALERRP